jgi:GH24 family phage-related lysozyme (muramidase)
MDLERCRRLTRLYYRTVERPDSTLESELGQAEQLVSHLVTVELTLDQTDALVCLVSDLLGRYCSAPSDDFPSSFLIRALNRGMRHVAVAQFSTFCQRDGRIDPRAWQKRQCEQRLFLRGQLMF